ncbi:MAG: hypothetical protein K1X74_01585 [Pirellulales bacterium]|nr:hypothetical protein [Pirellulales bacterium]
MPDAATPQRWTLDGPYHGMAVAREHRWVLAWHRDGRVQLLDSAGAPLAERTLPVAIAAADISDDGRIVAIAAASGKLYWFDRSLTRRRMDTLPAAPRVVALNVDGSHCAVALANGPILLLNCYGQSQGTAPSVRLVDRLLFADEEPALLALSEQGQLSWYEPDGVVRFSSHLALRASDLATTAVPSSLWVAAPALGLLRFDRRGESLPPGPPVAGPAELALSASGDRLLVASLAPELVLLTPGGEVLHREPLPSLPARADMDPLARRAWCLLENGQLQSVPLLSGKG